MVEGKSHAFLFACFVLLFALISTTSGSHGVVDLARKVAFPDDEEAGHETLPHEGYQPGEKGYIKYIAETRLGVELTDRQQEIISVLAYRDQAKLLHLSPLEQYYLFRELGDDSKLADFQLLSTEEKRIYADRVIGRSVFTNEDLDADEVVDEAPPQVLTNEDADFSQGVDNNMHILRTRIANDRLAHSRRFHLTCKGGCPPPPPVDPDDCAPKPCKHQDIGRTKCHDGSFSFSCSCKSSWGPTYSSSSGCKEINDCSPNPCGANAWCKDNGNGNWGRTPYYKCYCNSGYTPIGGSANGGCKQIDDCAKSPTCGANTKCVDGTNTRTCSCKTGYKKTGGSLPYGPITCVDIDDCWVGGYTCGANTNCADTGVNSRTCSCKPGYEGNPYSGCTPINDCLVAPLCPANSQCVDKHLGKDCYCNSGYEPNPTAAINCANIDDCNRPGGNPCGPLNDVPGAKAICTDDPTPATHTYTCTCPAGYNGNPDVLCNQINDCAISPCAANADCTDGTGFRTCTCIANYGGDPYTAGCTPICGNGLIQPGEQCDDGNPSSSDGCSSTCQIEPGWTCPTANSPCLDINECSPNPCGGNAFCTDVAGAPGHSCTCNSGYEGDPYAGCTDIDDCALPGACVANTVCVDTGANSWTCTCLPGYSPVGGSPPTACNDIDECAATPCAANTDCTTPNINSFECACSANHAGDPYVAGCVLEHFCIQPALLCKANTLCAEGTTSLAPPCDNVANYGTGQCTSLCTCKPGYEGMPPATNGASPASVACTEIDECALTGAQAPVCGPNGLAPNTVCTDKFMGYDCACAPGFEGDPHVGCTNIDDCFPYPCGANTICTDKVLGYDCSCKAGYEDLTATLPAAAATACTDIDDCLLPPLCGANTACTDHLLSRTCSCLPGYEGANPDAGCTDINECGTNPCGPNTICSEPSINMFHCQCITGHVGTPFNKVAGCYNFDDCYNPVNGSSCAGQTDCVDGIDAFTCTCKSGFEGNPYNKAGTCTDIDECTPYPCAANSTCTHGFGTGTYSCACKPGFTPDPTPDVYCQDIDDCALTPCGANTRCVDLVQARECHCLTGYNGDPYAGCVDIDECVDNPCHVDATCTNTVGSFTCDCLPGYGGDGFSCTPNSGVLFLYSYLTTSEDASTASYIVRLTYQPSNDVILKPNSTNPLEVQVTSGPLTFTPSTWAAFQTVTLTGVDDDQVDGAQEVDITHTIDSLDTNYLTLNPVLDVVKVSNADWGEIATVNLEGVGFLKVSESGTTATYTSVLTSRPYNDVTVIATSSRADYLAPATDTHTFTTTDWSIHHTITITGLDDGAVADGDHAVTMEHGVYSADMTYNELGNQTVKVTVSDNDQPPITNPEITFIFPAAQSGGPLEINGIRFGTPNSTFVITIGGKPCPFLSWNSNTSIVCDCPPGNGDEIPVSITVDGVANLAPYPLFFYVRDLVNPSCTLGDSRVNNVTHIDCEFSPGLDMPVDGYIYLTLPPLFYGEDNAANGPVPTASSIGLGDGFFDLGPLNVQVVTPENKYLKIFRAEPHTVVMRQGDRAKFRVNNMRMPPLVGDPGVYALTTFRRDGRPHEGPTPGSAPFVLIDRPSDVKGMNFQKITKVSVELHWSPPLYDNFSPIQSYEIMLDGAVVGTLAVTSPTMPLFYKAEGLSPYTSYYFRLRALNGAGYSAWTNELEVQTEYDRPVITAVEPLIGPTKGGTLITLFGMSFGTSKGDLSEVSVMDESCLASAVLKEQGVLTCLTPPSKSQTQLKLGDVVLVSTYGNTLAPVKFTYYPQPELSSISVNKGPAGGGTKVQITGAYFGYSENDVYDISMGGVSCKFRVYISETELECVTNQTPGKKAYSGKVAVTTVGGAFTSVWVFDYYNPDITHVYPNGAPVNQAGVPVTITGENLGVGYSDISSLTLAGESCLDTLWWESPSIIGCMSPKSFPHSGTVNITTESGGSGPSKLHMFSFLAGDANSLPPSITSITPTEGPFVGGTKVFIVGSWLGMSPTDLKSVVIAGVPCEKDSVAWKNSSVIECKTGRAPSATSGVVTVETVSGTSTQVVSFTYHYPDPLIESIRPKIVPSIGRTVVTIRGNFYGREDSRSTYASVGGVSCLTTSWISEQELHCLVPAYQTLRALNVTTGIVRARVGERVSKEDNFILEYAIEGTVRCDPECGWHADCVGGTCVCHYGWSIPPDCATPSVAVTPIVGYTTEYTNDTASFNVALSEKPHVNKDVVVKAKASDPTEAFVTPRSLTFTSENWDVNQTVIVEGLSDFIRDGNITYDIVLKVSEGDPVFVEGDSLRKLSCVNHETPPNILSIHPLALELSGGQVSLQAVNLDPSFAIEIDGKVYPHVVEAYTRPVTENDPLRNLRTLNEAKQEYRINMTLPNMPKGYHRIDLINDGGTRTMSADLLFFTDACPNEGEFGSAGNCGTCPGGAVCPGGGRIWAEPGYWIEDEESGVVIKCDPPSRCPGGRKSECAPGHGGYMCGQCDKGWYQPYDKCAECPPKEQIFQTIMAASIVWVSIAAATTLVTDRYTVSLAAFVVQAAQLLAGIGRLSSENVPADLRQIFEAMWVFSGDLSFHVPNCLWNITYPTMWYAKFVYTIGLYVFFLLGLAMSYYGQLWWHRMTTYEPVPQQIARIKQWHKDRVVRSFLLWWKLSFLSFCFNWFDAISCFKQGDKFYLITQRSVQCFQSPGYKIITAASVLLLVGWAALTPFLWAWRLRKKGPLLRSSGHVSERWGILYEIYRPGFSMFYLVDCFVIAVVAGGRSYLHPYPGAVWGLCAFFLVVRMVLIMVKRPFAEMKLTIAQMSISLGYFLAITLIYMARQNSLTASNAKTMMTLTIVLVGGPVALTFLAVLYIVFTDKKISPVCEDEKEEEEEIQDSLKSMIGHLNEEYTDDVQMDMMQTSSEGFGEDGDDEGDLDDSDDEDGIENALKRTMEIFSQDTWERKGDIFNGLIFGTAHASRNEDIALLEQDLDDVDLNAPVPRPVDDYDLGPPLDALDAPQMIPGAQTEEVAKQQFTTVTDDLVDETTFANGN